MATQTPAVVMDKYVPIIAQYQTCWLNLLLAALGTPSLDSPVMMLHHSCSLPQSQPKGRPVDLEARGRGDLLWPTNLPSSQAVQVRLGIFLLKEERKIWTFSSAMKLWLQQEDQVRLVWSKEEESARVCIDVSQGMACTIPSDMVK